MEKESIAATIATDSSGDSRVKPGEIRLDILFMVTPLRVVSLATNRGRSAEDEVGGSCVQPFQKALQRL